MLSTAAQQAPFAAVLGCIDSRVLPERVFDRNTGDIFIARVAGNIASPDIIGSRAPRRCRRTARIG